MAFEELADVLARQFGKPVAQLPPFDVRIERMRAQPRREVGELRLLAALEGFAGREEVVVTRCGVRERGDCEEAGGGEVLQKAHQRNSRYAGLSVSSQCG